MTASHYPDFDVLEEQGAWDEYTRSIVLQRTRELPPLQFLTPPEVAILACVLQQLLVEDRAPVLAFITSHFDRRLASTVGESQRKTDVPPEADLVRRGLGAIDAVATARHGRSFADCSSDWQLQILAALQKGQLEVVTEMQGIPQKELFQKMLTLAAEAFSSHPTVWSEMGYAGPAYPRGYYRLDRGVLDPWEPRAAGRRPREEGDGDGRSGA